MVTAHPSIRLTDGTSMPSLIYGSGTALRDREVADAVANAIKAGFRHVDCAQKYGNEESVGQGIARCGVPRSSLYITTKLERVPEGQTAVDSLRESLCKMNLDYVDLLLVHEPVPHKDLKQTWKEVERCKEEGLTRSIGVSNFRIQDLEEIRDGATASPVVNQIEYHPYIIKANTALLEYMKAHDILAVSYSGLAPIARVKEGPLDHILPNIADRLSATTGQKVTVAQVLQLWLRKQGVPYISTTEKPERLTEYLNVVSLPDLSNEEVQLITEVGCTVHHRFFVATYTIP